MSGVDQLRTLFEYHFETTKRLMEGAAELLPENYHAAEGSGDRSAHDLLFHILATDRGWRIGLETGARPEPLDPEAHGDLPSLRELMASEELTWRRMLAGFTGDGLDEEVELAAGPGRVMHIQRWRVLQHLILHGMQHHAELAQILTRHGSSPGNLDFIFYSRQ